MIARYTRQEMGNLWSDRSRYLRWLQVELAVARQQARVGMIPRRDFLALQAGIQSLIRKGGVEPARVEEIEKVTRHDVIAFTSAVTEKLGKEGRWLHFGLTSSDIVDTALSLSLKASGEILMRELRGLEKVLRKRAREFQKLPCLGRTHGMAAEPTSFGLKFLSWAEECSRNQFRLEGAVEQVSYGKLSGAVGCNAIIPPTLEAACLKDLGLSRERVSTQVLPRDRHAHFVQALALIGSSLERIAIELRHLQRSEVGEVREGFSKGQKGSSAMPHKRNPISSENITGCSRLLRSYASAALENVALWHERDISHSSVERVILPDSTQLLDYSIHRMTGIIENLEVDQARVRANLKAQGGVVGSGHVLLALVRQGAPREEAYPRVQAAAHAAMADGAKGFALLLSQDPWIQGYLTAKEIEKLVSMEYQLREVSGIFRLHSPAGKRPHR